MKKFVTMLLVLGSVLMNQMSFAKTPGTEVVRPVRPVHSSFKSVFLNTPTFIDAFKGSTSPLAKSEVLKYYDPSVEEEMFFPLLTHLGPIVDGNGDPTTSPDGDNYYFEEYGTRFESSLPRPRLDSVRIWFRVDSMEDVANNAIVVTATKLKQTELVSGDFVPTPDFGNTALKTLFIPRAQVADHIGDGYVHSIKVAFNNLLVPKEFFVAVGGKVTTDAQGTIVNNLLEIMADSIDLSGIWEDDAPIDTNLYRTYYVALNEASTYYQTFFRFIDDRNNSGVFFAPQAYMVAYLHDPTAAVDDQPLSGNALGVNYPNPVNESTEIPYSLNERSYTTVKVYNTLGNLIATPVDGYVDAGPHSVKFNADNLSNGTYYYTISAGNFTATKSMIVAK